MQTNRKRNLPAKLALVASLALTAIAPLRAANNLLYVDTTAVLSYTTFVGPIPIPGLSLNLPAASAVFNTALVTLSMPNLYMNQPASRTTPMSASLQVIAISPQGLVSASGSIGCDTPTVTTSARKPLTIVISVPLASSSQMVEAEWSSSGGTVNTDTFASLSAVLGRQ